MFRVYVKYASSVSVTILFSTVQIVVAIYSHECSSHSSIFTVSKTDPEHFQPLSSQCDMHVKLPHQATFALPEACFPAPMGSKSPIKYKEWMKALFRPHLTKIENDQKIRKTFLKNLIVVDFLLWAPGQSYHPSHIFAPPNQV